ncbi:zinc metallo ase-disintegrin-like crotastatin [Pelobates cultripes]|uniref:Zinc metallo ase-disintegrin-like crotastatin n=1 Tax=Pelobates cultripes TaxID=61616 RepID=A0AAD1RQY0_PELCU|nr:zinc metallo ase-disintegrin-like crotastatin [Pelobates cultripes]
MLHPVLLILAGVLFCQVLASSNRLPEGQKYEVVFPQKLHTQHKRDTQSNHPDVVHYGLVLEGKPLVLQLKRTEGLISDDYTETLYLPDGTPITHSPKIQDHCYYHGHVKNDDDSMASVSTCRGLSGVIHTRSRRFLIEPLNATDSDEHAVYEDKDETPRTCGVTNTTWLDNKVVKSSRSSNIEKQLFYASQKFVKMYVVLDTTMVSAFEENVINLS